MPKFLIAHLAPVDGEVVGVGIDDHLVAARDATGIDHDVVGDIDDPDGSIALGGVHHPLRALAGEPGVGGHIGRTRDIARGHVGIIGAELERHSRFKKDAVVGTTDIVRGDDVSADCHAVVVGINRDLLPASNLSGIDDRIAADIGDPDLAAGRRRVDEAVGAIDLVIRRRRDIGGTIRGTSAQNRGQTTKACVNDHFS